MIVQESTHKTLGLLLRIVLARGWRSWYRCGLRTHIPCSSFQSRSRLVGIGFFGFGFGFLRHLFFSSLARALFFPLACLLPLCCFAGVLLSLYGAQPPSCVHRKRRRNAEECYEEKQKQKAQPLSLPCSPPALARIGWASLVRPRLLLAGICGRRGRAHHQEAPYKVGRGRFGCIGCSAMRKASQARRGVRARLSPHASPALCPCSTDTHNFALPHVHTPHTHAPAPSTIHRSHARIDSNSRRDSCRRSHDGVVDQGPRHGRRAADGPGLVHHQQGRPRGGGAPRRRCAPSAWMPACILALSSIIHVRTLSPHPYPIPPT